MDDFEFDLNLDELKTVDINTNNNSIARSSPSFNISTDTGSSSANVKTINMGSRPDLTISTSNHDSMPPPRSTSTTDFNFGDKEVDFGLDMIMNKKMVKNNTSGTPPGTPAPSVPIGGVDTYGSKPVTLTNDILSASAFDDGLTNIDLDKELNSIDINSVKPPKSMSMPTMPNFGSPPSTNYMNMNTNMNNNFGGSSSNSFSGGSATDGLSYEDIQKLKFDLLCKLERLRAKGIKFSRQFSMSSDYNEMKYEYDRLVHERKLDNSIKMSRNMLITFVSGIEYLNNKFDPFDLKLDNWSSQMNDNINDYDDVFEELYEKYKESANMAPEMRLMFMVGGSAFMYHLNQTMFKGLAPSAQDVFNQNPDLLRQFNDAAMRQTGGNGFANMMGMMGSGGSSAPPPPKFPGMGAGLSGIPGAGRPNINNTDDVDAMIANITSS